MIICEFDFLFAWNFTFVIAYFLVFNSLLTLRNMGMTFMMKMYFVSFFTYGWHYTATMKACWWDWTSCFLLLWHWLHCCLSSLLFALLFAWSRIMFMRVCHFSHVAQKLGDHWPDFLFFCFVEYASNGSLYNFLRLPQSEQLTFENTVEWARDIARGESDILLVVHVAECCCLWLLASLCILT